MKNKNYLSVFYGIILGFAIFLLLGAAATTALRMSSPGICSQAVQFENLNNWFYGHGDHLTGVPSDLPDQSGHTGEYLTTDGSTASWAAGGGGSVSDDDRSTGWTSTTDAPSQRAVEQAMAFYSSEWSLIKRYEIVASGGVTVGKTVQVDGAQQTLTFTGLNGDQLRKIKIEAKVTTAASGDISCWMTFNTDTTNGHYLEQQLYGTDTTPGASRASRACIQISYTSGANLPCDSTTIFNLKTGMLRTGKGQIMNCASTSAVGYIFQRGYFYTDGSTDSTNITQVVLTSDNVAGIGVGSVIELYGPTE